MRAALPGFIAKKLCPHLEIVPVNLTKYRVVSQQIRQVYEYYDPNFSGMGLDEAYLDFTNHIFQRSVMSKKERTFKTVLTGVLCDCGHRVNEEEFTEEQLENAIRMSELCRNDSKQTDNSNSTSHDIDGVDEPLKIINGSETKCVLECPACNSAIDWSKRVDIPHASYEHEDVVTFGTDVDEAVNEMRFKIFRLTLLTASAGK